ncbi:MAG TPA: hypothetical protein VJ925_13030 [Longimicrobiales bacterium]|nr:hypothetical protein [Longimicrobiales bacterium]
MRPSLRLSSPFAALLALASACSPGDDAEATADGAETPGAVAVGGADSDAFVDGPDLWLAELTYDDTGAPMLGDGRNVTSRAGYDNQPKFLPDGSILYTRGVGDRTDIWLYDPATDAHAPVTETPDHSEYSPTPTPDGTGFSAIVVEPDSLQRLWRFDLDGSNGGPIFEDIAPVGYHAWIDDERIGMFVLGEPATLQTAVAGAAGPGATVDEDIGRSLNRIPGQTAISYPVAPSEDRVLRMTAAEDSVVTVPLRSSGWFVRMLADVDGELATRFVARIPAQDHAWTPDGRILYAEGHRLMAIGPLPTAPGEEPALLPDDALVTVGALPDTTLEISRLAVSDDGASIVLVVDRPNG